MDTIDDYYKWWNKCESTKPKTKNLFWGWGNNQSIINCMDDNSCEYIYINSKRNFKYPLKGKHFSSTWK